MAVKGEFKLDGGHALLGAAAAVLMTAALSAPASATGNCAAMADLDGIKLPAACLTAEEGQAIRLRVFRADLAVAALSCNQQGLYNTLVTRHQDELVDGGRVLKATFARLHQSRATYELNRFITHLANRASIQSLGVPGYCGVMARVFQAALATPRRGLTAFALGGAVVAAIDTAAGPAPAAAQPAAKVAANKVNEE